MRSRLRALAFAALGLALLAAADTLVEGESFTSTPSSNAAVTTTSDPWQPAARS